MSDPIKWSLEQHQNALPTTIIIHLEAKYKAIYKHAGPETKHDIADHAANIEHHLYAMLAVIREAFKGNDPGDSVEILTLATAKPLDEIFADAE